MSTRVARSRTYFANPLVQLSSSVSSYMQQFMDTRKGAGAGVFSDMGLNYTVYTVTTTDDNGSKSSPTPGSLRAACATTGKKIIRFQPGLTADIIPPSRLNIPMTSDTLIDGYGYAGTIRSGLNGAGNTNNIGGIYLSLHEPWAYGELNSNKQLMSFGNCKGGYMRWCTLWDGGDVLIASGAYSPQAAPAPYYYTVEECLLGPTPGEYALMAPMRGAWVDKGPWQANTAYPKLSTVTYGGYTWYAAGPMEAASTFDMKAGWVMPGLINAIDNDARNGKILNSAVDHNYLDAFLAANNDGTDANGKYIKGAAYYAEEAKYSRAAFSTIINNIMQGGTVRVPKSKGQTMDVVGNLIAKYGHPYRAYAGTTASNTGGGVSCEDEALMNIEGNVWIPKELGEQVFAMLWARADQLGVPRMTVDASGLTSQAIAQDGAKTGDAFISPNNYLPQGRSVAQALADGLIEPINAYNGYDRTASRTVNGQTMPGYSLSLRDVSTLTGARAQVAYLEANCGNPFATIKPPSWRAVHTSSDFLNV